MKMGTPADHGHHAGSTDGILVPQRTITNAISISSRKQERTKFLDRLNFPPNIVNYHV
jgi:hypothetical protein